MAELKDKDHIPTSVLEHVEDNVRTDVTTVLVTGFGPFLDKFPVNSSWSIASSLPALLPESKDHSSGPIRILVHPWPIRVAYASVLAEVPTLYETTSPRPDLILHLGLAAGRDYFALERGAHRSVFGKNKDVDGQTFPREESDKLWGGLPDFLRTGFDTGDLWRRWRSKLADKSIDIRESADAGNYLCGFIYYTSMAQFVRSKDEERPVLFMHTPDLPTEEELEKGRETVIALIRGMVDSWREKKATHGNLE